MPERFRGELLTMGRYTNPASFTFLYKCVLILFDFVGGQIGTVFGMPVSGFLCEWFGWESVFYFFGENSQPSYLNITFLMVLFFVWHHSESDEFGTRR